MSGSHRQISSSQHELDGIGGPTTHTEVARPLDRKDVLVHGSLKNLDRQQSEKADQEAFHRTSVKRREEQKAAEAARSGVASPTVPPKKSWMPPQLRQALKEMVDISIYKNVVFLIFSLASFLGMIAFYIPFTFITDLAGKRFEVDKDKAAYLISGIGGANIFGRIFWGWLADRPRSDPLLIHNVCVTIVGITLGFVPLCDGYNSVMVICIVFGFFVCTWEHIAYTHIMRKYFDYHHVSLICSGTYFDFFCSAPFISLLSIILTSRIGLEQLPSAFGQSQLVRGIASMCGTPIGGERFL